MSSDLKVGIVTKEWPPQVYGGAGVHVFQLTQALRSISGVQVDVHCFGGERSDGAFGYDTPSGFTSGPAHRECATNECKHLTRSGIPPALMFSTSGTSIPRALRAAM